MYKLLIVCGVVLIALDDGLKQANFSKNYSGKNRTRNSNNLNTIYELFKIIISHLFLIPIAEHEGFMIMIAVLIFTLIDMISQWWKLDYNHHKLYNDELDQTVIP